MRWATTLLVTEGILFRCLGWRQSVQLRKILVVVLFYTLTIKVLTRSTRVTVIRLLVGPMRQGLRLAFLHLKPLPQALLLATPIQRTLPLTRQTLSTSTRLFRLG